MSSPFVPVSFELMVRRLTLNRERILLQITCAGFFFYRDSLISRGPLSHEVSEKEAIEIVKALPPPNLPTKVCAVLGAPPAQHTPSSESLPDPNKTSTAFWKPVYALVGTYIDAGKKNVRLSHLR